MVVRDIATILESWAPAELAWERDNVGLQVGSLRQIVRNVLVTLDVSEDVVSEARRLGTDLIISHHPLVFQPIRSVTDHNRIGRVLLQLAKSRISLFVAHTNLDFATSGVSAALARKLGILNLSVIAPQKKSLMKIAVFVPADQAGNVRQAMAGAGAGRIGNYDSCSWETEGRGTFRPLKNANPFVGRRGRLETVREQCLEMVCPAWTLPAVISAMKNAHPYEEVAYDVFHLANEIGDCGAGIIGELQKPMSYRNFLQHTRRRLRTRALRHVGDAARIVSRIAVCGGSGSDLLHEAIRAHADVFVTADVKYHTFQDAEGRIALIDAGHYETEVPILESIKDRIKEHSVERGSKLNIRISHSLKNPVQYFCS